MNNIQKYHNHCCGCGLCAEICPNNAIVIEENDFGFSFPQVDVNKCNECGLCIKKCAFNQNSRNQRECTSKFLVQHKDLSIRMNSRSGGAFTALSDEIIKRNGVVYGCKLSSSFLAEHGRANNKQSRDSFLGSKYTQSIIKDCYKRIKEDLQKGMWVLFSGTPCQVDAIKAFCRSINTDKLILVDIVCFGIPGRKIWSDYLKSIETNFKSKIISVDFRDKKKFGWANHVETVDLENGEQYDGEIYARLFEKRLIIRDACFQCPYKNLHRVGDITLADAWGIDEQYSDFNDNKGTSLVLVNSEKGEVLFNQTINQMEYIKLESLNGFLQPCLKDNWSKPDNYNDFWNDCLQMSFDDLANKYTSMSVKSIVNSKKDKNENLFRKIIRKMKLS